MHGAMISVCLFVRVQLMTCKFHQKAKESIMLKASLKAWLWAVDTQCTMCIREAS